MNIIKNIFLIIVLLQFNNKLFSQDVKEFKLDGFAINPKVGGPAFSENGGDDAVVIGLELNFIKNKFIYSIDYLGHNKIGILIGFSGPSQNQFDIMMGKYIGEKYFRFQYQAGINVFWGEYSSPGGSQAWVGLGGGSRKPFSTIGAVSKAGLKFIPLKKLSIGMDFLINLNFVNTMFIPMLSIEVGELRNAIKSNNN